MNAVVKVRSKIMFVLRPQEPDARQMFYGAP
jgi:hypothetical protein